MISVRSNKYLKVIHSEHEQINLMSVHIYPTVLVKWLMRFCVSGNKTHSLLGVIFIKNVCGIDLIYVNNLIKGYSCLIFFQSIFFH